MIRREFSLASARQAAADDRLAQWVVDFLASPGSNNEALAASLALSDTAYFGPIELDLDRLTPLAGPHPDEVVVPVDEAQWESDIGSMEESLEHGWHPPPLLVSYHDGTYLLEDGNHRHETLRRHGATRAWTILLFRDAAHRDRYLETHGRTDDADSPRGAG